MEKCLTAGETKDYDSTAHALCSLFKAADTHCEYVILIACPLQQCLHERTSMLRYDTLTLLFILPTAVEVS